MEVEVAPRAVEWEKRQIWHAIQCSHDLLNSEHMDDDLVNKIQTTKINFLSATFEELATEKFFSPKGLAAFIRTWYH